MALGPLHSYVHAPRRSQAYAPPLLPPKTPATRRSYAADFSALLLDAGTTLAGAAVRAQAPLAVDQVSWSGATVRFRVRGGAPGALASLCIALLLADGGREDVVLGQPIEPADPAIPESALTVAGEVVTVAVRPLEVAAMAGLPGGAQPSDLVLLVRPPRTGPDGLDVPSVAGTVPFAALGGGGLAATAGATLSGHRAVMADPLGRVVHADPSAPGYGFVGVTTQAAVAGAPVLVATEGMPVGDPGWSWTPGAPLFVGAGGVLGATPPVAGVLHQVAVATAATALLVQSRPPIVRR